MKTLAIVNSLCLKRLKRADLLVGQIREALGAEIRYTEHKDHASEIAKGAYGFDAVLSVGGDGTLFEIINGTGPAGYRIGLIPIGTANSLAYDLGIYSLDRALGAIRRKRHKEIDLIEARFNQNGRPKHRYVAFAAGMGFFADAAKSANLHFKNLGKLCYPAASLFCSFGNKEITCEVSLDGTPFIKRVFTNLLIANTAHVGYMRVLKEAGLTDGRFNLWLGRIGTLRQLIWDLSIITGGHFYSPASEYKLSRLEIRLEQPCGMMLDGESFDSVTSAEFSILPKKLSVFC